MSSIQARARECISLSRYNDWNGPEFVSRLDLIPPAHEQYILRMLVARQPYEDFLLPPQLEWVKPMLDVAISNQRRHSIRQPYCSITVRHGIVHSENDDTWHVDGFSVRYSHLPEQNYIWVDKEPTEFVVCPIAFPRGFDPLKHNIHLFLQEKVSRQPIQSVHNRTVYCMDPYVIHRRPSKSNGKQRTFVRISFTPLEIMDVNNTLNPFLETHYTYDGIRDFRDKLENFQVAAHRHAMY